MSWTEEKVALLKKLWEDGKSASEIATKLGANFTRNSVIGKAHRLDLSGRPSPIKVNAEAPKKEKSVKLVSLLDLTDRMCKWPFGDPKDSDFHFCGKQVISGLSYCEEHCKTAYQVLPPSNEKKEFKTVG